MSYLERIRRLRDRAVSPKICYHEFWLNFYRVYDGNNYGDAFYHAMGALTPVIEDDELIVGRTVPCLSPEDAAEWETKVKPVAQQYSWKAGGGQDSHMAVDYDLLLREGIDGILAKIAAYREKNGASEFYDTCEKCLEGVKLLAAHYSERAAAMAAECTDAARKAELLRISEVCARVPAKPAQSFHEAVQSVNLVTHCLSMNPFRLCHQQFQLGHPDRYLYPYFRADMDA
ncbi:MAG: hypothetical protein IJF67_10845, partial [Clostridia bacterium]|nr:hypothetical protein [Clostridia bacterium]